MRHFCIYIILFTCLPALGQDKNKLEFDGQLSVLGSYSPENHMSSFVGGRYLPELSYGFNIDSTKKIDFEASVNISGSLLFHPFDSLQHNGNISPYRIWARYSDEHLEVRLGLQKIDFGSARLLRPIQWFNQIDPRDPLQLTNGVYGALGKYHFKNNANIWLWALYGNEKRRGFDSFGTSKWEPEVGGRFQLPVPRGEVAASYHYRNASTENSIGVPSYGYIPENRIGIDAKWDIAVGLWVEAAWIHKSGNLLGVYNDQTSVNLGFDYTFGLGNGLGIAVEHLTLTFDERPLQFANMTHFTASTLTYPIGLFDNLNVIVFYNWHSGDPTFLINFQHQFERLTGYLMVYYNPPVSGFVQNDLVNSFSGPGIRLMLVYNH